MAKDKNIEIKKDIPSGVYYCDYDPSVITKIQCPNCGGLNSYRFLQKKYVIWRCPDCEYPWSQEQYLLLNQYKEELKRLREVHIGCVSLANKVKELRLELAKRDGSTEHTETINVYRDGLIYIRDHPHCNYDGTFSPYSVGAVDGHRCASKIARDILEKE
jgi:ribosomal protein L37AE/L43A